MLWPRSWAAAICSDGLRRWLAGRRSAEPLRRVGIQGNARVSRPRDCGLFCKDCFGETPKPTREMRALPGQNGRKLLQDFGRYRIRH